jgi:hypothetical protein
MSKNVRENTAKKNLQSLDHELVFSLTNWAKPHYAPYVIIYSTCLLASELGKQGFFCFFFLFSNLGMAIRIRISSSGDMEAWV